MIQVEHLVKRYGETCAVRDISFRVRDGEVIGFLGPNGAGKTTTMNILTGCLEATSGDVRIGGKHLEEDPLGIRRAVGYLPEQPPLYPDMTVAEYLTFVYALKKYKAPDSREAYLAKICGMAGLSEVTGRLIRNLSKGYRQRVGRAGALIGDPKVLILDEPTVGLDPKQIIEIRELIRELGKERTVILSSHILPEVQSICDRVLVINEGQIVADGTPRELSERMSGTPQLELTIEGDPAEVQTVLRAVPGVSQVEQVRQEGAKALYRVTSESDVRHAVFDVLSQGSFAILSMKQLELSLEDIFLKLTDHASEQAAERTEPARKKKKKRRLFGAKKHKEVDSDDSDLEA